MSNKTFKAFVDKMGGTTATNYIGNEGELFYDPTTTTLRVADGTTPGGIIISSGGGVSGNIEVVTTDSQINFVANSSGDGLNAATIELIPDSSLAENGQYLVIDPTAPSHIHIRAGGAIDSSGADLFLGGEKSHARVRDSAGVRLQNYRDVETNDFYGSGFTDATWYTSGSFHYVEFTTTDPGIINSFTQLNNNIDNRLTVYYDGGASSYTLQALGTSSGEDLYTVQVDVAPPASPTTIETLNFQIFTIRQNELILENNDLTVRATDDIRIYASDIFSLYNYSPDSPIRIYTDYDNVSYEWSFNPDGTLRFPDGGDLRLKYGAPDTSIGAAGDKAQMLVLDSSYLYYCTADYDGVTNIWKRIQWSNDTW